MKRSADAYCNNLRADEGERRLGQHSPPSEEMSLVSSYTVIIGKRTGLFPVPESETIMIWSTSQVQNDAENNETYNDPVNRLIDLDELG